MGRDTSDRRGFGAGAVWATAAAAWMGGLSVGWVGARSATPTPVDLADSGWVAMPGAEVGTPATRDGRTRAIWALGVAAGVGLGVGAALSARRAGK